MNEALSQLQDRSTAAEANTPAARQKSEALDRAYSDYCRLQETGEAPDPSEFCSRFPGLRTSLHRLLEAHHFFAENAHRRSPFHPLGWPEPGTTFLGYSLIRELGRGAFARVFLATEPALGHRQVAVKISLQGHVEAETLG